MYFAMLANFMLYLQVLELPLIGSSFVAFVAPGVAYDTSTADLVVKVMMSVTMAPQPDLGALLNE
jgi:hypothetical protein